MADQKLKGKVAFVGAGAKNLGGLISRQLAEMGAKVAAHYNSDSTKADAVATVAAIKVLGSDAFATQADLTKPSEVTRVFDEAIKQFGGIDVAVNTTGMVIKKPIELCTEEDYDKIFAINSKAAFFSCKLQAKSSMIAERSSRLLLRCLPPAQILTRYTPAVKLPSNTSLSPPPRSSELGASR